MMHVAYPHQVHQSMARPSTPMRPTMRRPTASTSNLPPLPPPDSMHPDANHGEKLVGKEPKPQCLASVGVPEGTPLEYVKHRIYQQIPQASEWSKGLLTPKMLSANSPCPSYIDVVVPPSCRDVDRDLLPSHIIAVPPLAATSSSPLTAFFDSLEPPQPAVIRLFPARTLVLAAYCTNLPPVTPSHRPPTTNWQLPVWVLKVPRPESFHIVHEYMHEQQPMALFSAFVPSLCEEIQKRVAMAAPGGQSSHVLPHSVAGLFTAEDRNALSHLLEVHAYAQAQRLGKDPLGLVYNHARRIIDSHKNARFLGLSDHEFWNILLMSYNIVYGAADLIRRRQL